MKFGLGESYDNVGVLSKKARAYADLTKPASSLGVAGGYFIGSLFYFQYTTNTFGTVSELISMIYVVFTMFVVHGASQALNMAEDAEMDANTPHKQNRPIPAGVIEVDEARTLAWIFMLFGIGRAYLVNQTFGVFVSLLAFFGIFYNLDPIRAKSRSISIPWQAASRGLLSFPTIWAAYGNPWQPLPWVLGIMMFWYVFGFQNSADIIDREVDKEYGIKTMAVMFGHRGISLISAGSMLMMVGTIVGAVSMGIIPEKFIWMLGIMPFCLVMWYHMTFNPDMVSEKTGNHPAWLWFYIGMVLSVVIPLVVELHI